MGHTCIDSNLVVNSCIKFIIRLWPQDLLWYWGLISKLIFICPIVKQFNSHIFLTLMSQILSENRRSWVPTVFFSLSVNCHETLEVFFLCLLHHFDFRFLLLIDWPSQRLPCYKSHELLTKEKRWTHMLPIDICAKVNATNIYLTIPLYAPITDIFDCPRISVVITIPSQFCCNFTQQSQWD